MFVIRVLAGVRPFVVVFGAGVVLVGQSYSSGGGAGGASGVCWRRSRCAGGSVVLVGGGGGAGVCAGGVRADAGGVGVGLDVCIS